VIPRRLAALGLATAFGSAACGPIGDEFGSQVGLVVENRTNWTLALSPDLRIEPCGEATFTRRQVAEALQAERLGFVTPHPLVGIQIPDEIAQDAATRGPVVTVVTGRGMEVVKGPLDRAALPPCEDIPLPRS
jgi:hypothetical protein